MPFTTTGIFERSHNWEEDRLNGIEIVTDHHDEEDDNFAEGLSQTFLRDGRTPMEGHINMGGFKITNCAPATNATDVATKADLDAIDRNFVPIMGDAQIYDTKEFISSPLVPTAPINDASQKASSTAFVKTQIDNAFNLNKSSYLEAVFPTYSTVNTISNGYTTPSIGYVLFTLPPRMVGSIEIGEIKKSFAYNYNNTQPSLCLLPVAKGVTIRFSGCTAEFIAI